MNQISRPLQIALAAVVVLAIAWVAFLRPSEDESESAQQPVATTATTSKAPGVTGLNKAVEKAEQAKTTSDKQATALANATGTETATTPSSTTTTTTAAPAPTTSTKGTGTGAVKPAGPPINDPATKDSGDPAQGLLDRLKGDRVVVLLFAGKGADDEAAKRAVRRAAVSRPGLIVRITDIRNVGKYATITDQLGINGAPSTVIIGSDRMAQVLTGIVDSKSIRQFAGDAQRRAAKARR